MAGVPAIALSPAGERLWLTDAWAALDEGTDTDSFGHATRTLAECLCSLPVDRALEESTELSIQPRTNLTLRITAKRHRPDGNWLCVVNLQKAAFTLPADASDLDVVTRLPGRAWLEGYLEARFVRDEPFGLLFIDMNGFKQINDTLGHLAGDDALRVAAARMRSAIRDGDVIARFGGDEFVALIEGVRSMESLRPLEDRLLAALEPPIELSVDRQLHAIEVSASTGTALSADCYESARAMMHAADIRMYASRRSGEGGSRVEASP